MLEEEDFNSNLSLSHPPRLARYPRYVLHFVGAGVDPGYNSGRGDRRICSFFFRTPARMIHKDESGRDYFSSAVGDR